MNDRHVEILAFYALGVPVPLLSQQYGLKPNTIQKLAIEHKVKRPASSDKAVLCRVSRVERMQRHMAESPSVSLRSDMEKAA